MNDKRTGFGKFRVLVIVFLLIALPVSASAGEKWETLMLTDCCHQLYSVSSELGAPKDPTKFGKYGAQNLFDRNPATCWAEGEADSGIGQKIQVAVRGIPDKIKLINGYGKSPALFAKNNRIREIQLSCYAAFFIEGHATELATELNALKFPVEKTVTIADQTVEQKINFPFDRAKIAAFLKQARAAFFQNRSELAPKKVQLFLLISLKIRSVYRGNKWNDTCLSELSFSSPALHAGKTTSSITINKGGNTVFVEYSDATKETLVKDTGSVFQIVEVSPDKKWVILIRMPAHPGPGRVETQYLLYNIELKKPVLPDPAHPEIGALYGFETENHTLSLQYEDTITGEIQNLNLSDLITNRK
ncbi:MAG: hypothetical protein GXO70_07920 [Acidobacteria bacterium]|nr:hypothetical protein [Acidobacteriota bacterium]